MNAIQRLHRHDTASRPSVLVIGDDPLKLSALSQKLSGSKDHPSDVTILGSPILIREMLGRLNPDVVVASGSSCWPTVRGEMDGRAQVPLIFIDDQRDTRDVRLAKKSAGRNRKIKTSSSEMGRTSVRSLGLQSTVDYRTAMDDDLLAELVHKATLRTGGATAVQRWRSELNHIAV